MFQFIMCTHSSHWSLVVTNLQRIMTWIYSSTQLLSLFIPQTHNFTVWLLQQLSCCYFASTHSCFQFKKRRVWCHLSTKHETWFCLIVVCVRVCVRVCVWVCMRACVCVWINCLSCKTFCLKLTFWWTKSSLTWTEQTFALWFYSNLI